MADPARTLAYLKRHPDRTLRRYEILTILVDFANRHHGATPGERALWREFRARAAEFGFRTMSYYTFLVHMKTLVNDDKLVEKRDGVIVIPDSSWKLIGELPIVKANRAPGEPKASTRASRSKKRDCAPRASACPAPA